MNAGSGARAGRVRGCGVSTAASPWEAAVRREPGPALRGTHCGGDRAFDPFRSPGGCLSQTRPAGPRVEPFVELTQLGTAINCPHRGAGAVTSTRSGEVSWRKEVSGPLVTVNFREGSPLFVRGLR